MNDLISRQAAIDLTWKDPSYSDPLNVLTEVRDGIKALPSAQPEPKNGKWEVRHGILMHDGIYGDMYYCSECGHYERDPDGHNFCLNCGADMRGEEE